MYLLHGTLIRSLRGQAGGGGGGAEVGGDGRGGERVNVNGLGRVRAQKKAEERPIPTHLRGQKRPVGSGDIRQTVLKSPETTNWGIPPPILNRFLNA